VPSGETDETRAGARCRRAAAARCVKGGVAYHSGAGYNNIIICVRACLVLLLYIMRVGQNDILRDDDNNHDGNNRTESRTTPKNGLQR
jgi:hypothetical protein